MKDLSMQAHSAGHESRTGSSALQGESCWGAHGASLPVTAHLQPGQKQGFMKAWGREGNKITCPCVKLERSKRYFAGCVFTCHFMGFKQFK